MIKLSLTILGLQLAQVAFSQNNNRYMVFFSDKADKNNTYSISDPSAFLTQRAIDRRTRQNIAIDETDLPVSPEYVASLRDIVGVNVYFTTKWMNAVLVEMSEDMVRFVQTQTYVDNVSVVALGTKLSSSPEAFSNPSTFAAPPFVTSSTRLQLSMLSANIMHEDNIKGQGMLIAVLDGGFEGVNLFSPFQDLWTDNRIIAHKDFVANSGNVFQYDDHGTAVLSTIGAKHEPVFYGVAYEAAFILCVTEDVTSENRIEEYNWIFGAEYADSLGADVLNVSLGYRNFDLSFHNYSYEDLDGKTAVISKASKTATDKGMIVVVSGGNIRGNVHLNWRYVKHPADAAEVLAIGSVNYDYSRSSFSSVGPTVDDRIKPDVVALGTSVIIVSGAGAITNRSGTSLAAPQVAGVIAGIWQVNPNWTNKQVMDALKGSGHRAWNPDNQVGYGVPNYTYAVKGRMLNVTDIFEDRIKVYPNPFHGNKLYLTVEGQWNEPIHVKIINAKGKSLFDETIEISTATSPAELTIRHLGPGTGTCFLFLEAGDLKKIVKLIKL